MTEIQQFQLDFEAKGEPDATRYHLDYKGYFISILPIVGNLMHVSVYKDEVSIYNFRSSDYKKAVFGAKTAVDTHLKKKELGI